MQFFTPRPSYFKVLDLPLIMAILVVAALDGYNNALNTVVRS
jgi:hypothetical protein